jgi:hypothetical protein
MNMCSHYYETVNNFNTDFLFSKSLLLLCPISCGHLRMRAVINQAFLPLVTEQTCQPVRGKSEFDPEHAQQCYS